MKRAKKKRRPTLRGPIRFKYDRKARPAYEVSDVRGRVLAIIPWPEDGSFDALKVAKAIAALFDAKVSLDRDGWIDDRSTAP